MPSKRTPNKGVAFAVALLASLLLLASTAQARQSQRPIKLKGLVDAVKINGLSTAELVQQIERRGVDFEMNASAESELRGVGARPEVIEAARVNYRPPVVASSTPVPTHTLSGPKSNVSQPVPPGPALSKNEIITMLQGGITSARVEQFVEARGVTFTLTPDTTNEIKSAGGDRSLIGAITEKASSSNTAVASAIPESTAPKGPDYDDYVDKIQSAMSYSDWNSAITLSRQAIQLDGAQPVAYSYLGQSLLYGRRDFDGAEQAMRMAIERGGSAVFHVYHDHVNGNFQQYCEGSFFVTKSGVSFKANDGNDTFETSDSNIKEAKTNSWFAANIGAFHIKPVQQINGRGNFNFAPGSGDRAEALLIIRLIQAYQ